MEPSRAKDKVSLQQGEEDVTKVGQGLKNESSIKVFTDFSYHTSLETFGPRLIMCPSEPRPSRRQRELATLRKEKKVEGG